MPKIGIGISFITAIHRGAAAILAYITDNLALYFNFAKEDSADPVYTGHKEVRFGSAGSTSFGGAADDDYIDTGTNVGTSIGDDAKAVTISAWFNIGKTGNDAGLVYFGSFASSNGELGISFNASDQVRFYTANEGYLTYTSALTVGKWYHVTCTYDGTKKKIFVDGVFAVEEAEATAPDLDGLKLIFGSYYSTTYGFTGKISNVGVWSRVLSLNEIQAIMRKSYSDLGTTEKQSLEGWWGLDSAAINPAIKMDVATKGAIKLSGGASDEMGEGEAEKTAVFWMKWDGSSGGSNGSGLTGGSGTWMTYLRVQSNGTISFYDNTAYRASDAGVIVSGQWHMVTLSQSDSAGNHSMYVDGTHIRTDSGSTDEDNQWRYMGNFAGRNYGGQFASAAWYNKVLSSTEVSSLYALGRYGDMSTIATSNCKGWWHFDSVVSIEDKVGDIDITDGDGDFTACSLSSEATDSVGSNNGSISGATTTVSVYGGNAPKLARTIDVAAETYGDAIGGGSFEFDDTSSPYSLITSDLATALSNIYTNRAFSMSMWVKRKVGANIALIMIGGGTGEDRFSITMSGGKFYVWSQETDATGYYIDMGTQGVPPEEKWVHMVFIHRLNDAENGDIHEIFHDGVLADSGNLNGENFRFPEFDGQDITSWKQFYFGDFHVAQMGIWSRVLTTAEINSIREKTYSDLTTSEKVNLEVYLPLDTAPVNAITLDSTSNNHDGALV